MLRLEIYEEYLKRESEDFSNYNVLIGLIIAKFPFEVFLNLILAIIVFERELLGKCWYLIA